MPCKGTAVCVPVAMAGCSAISWASAGASATSGALILLCLPLPPCYVL